MPDSDSNRRLIAIGDVHGHSETLDRLLGMIEVQADDLIVTLGDYVNRGHDAKGVIERLIRLRGECCYIPILGNHDEMMLDARRDQHALGRFVHDGGDETLASYGGLQHVPEAHWEFLESCLGYYCVEGYAFTHASYDPYLRWEDQPASLLRWTSIGDSGVRRHRSGATVIVGHSADEQIRDYECCICIDTGCGFGGSLTAYECRTGEIWQADEKRIER